MTSNSQYNFDWTKPYIMNTSLNYIIATEKSKEIVGIYPGMSLYQIYIQCRSPQPKVNLKICTQLPHANIEQITACYKGIDVSSASHNLSASIPWMEIK